MVRKKDIVATVCVDLNENEKKAFAKVKKKYGARTNAETMRVLIKQTAEGN